MRLGTAQVYLSTRVRCDGWTGHQSCKADFEGGQLGVRRAKKEQSCSGGGLSSRGSADGCRNLARGSHSGRLGGFGALSSLAYSVRALS